MNKYALTLILKPDLEEKVRKELLDSVAKKFGKMEKEELWGNRDMAFKIGRQTKGYYVHYFFEAEPQNVRSLDKDLKMEEDILRHLLVRV